MRRNFDREIMQGGGAVILCGLMALGAVALIVDEGFFSGEYLSPSSLDSAVRAAPEHAFTTFGLVGGAAAWLFPAVIKARQWYIKNNI